MSSPQKKSQTQPPVPFEGIMYQRACRNFVYGGCQDGACPDGYAHIYFCVHCVNGECNYGDKCKNPQAFQIVGKNGKVTAATECFWVIENENTDDIYFYFANKAVAAKKQALRKAEEDEIKAKKVAEVAAITVKATGPIIGYKAPLTVVQRDALQHVDQAKSYLKAAASDSKSIESALLQANKIRVTYSNMLDILVNAERNMTEEFRTTLTSFMKLKLTDDQKKVVNDTLNDLPAPIESD
jgi:hypothetical protein